jgi:hypothetical protein
VGEVVGEVIEFALHPIKAMVVKSATKERPAFLLQDIGDFEIGVIISPA